jgi:hypothetical protein
LDPIHISAVAAFGTWAQVAAAAVIAWLALRQLKHEQERRREERGAAAKNLAEQRERQLEAETQRVCGLYDNDPVLNRVCRRIWDGSSNGTSYPGSIKKHDVIILTNYLDGIAIGILQDIYNEAMVKDNLKQTFYKVHDIILPSVFPEKNEREDGYEAFHKVVDRWQQEDNERKQANAAPGYKRQAS